MPTDAKGQSVAIGDEVLVTLRCKVVETFTVESHRNLRIVPVPRPIIKDKSGTAVELPPEWLQGTVEVPDAAGQAGEKPPVIFLHASQVEKVERLKLPELPVIEEEE